jgi:hypothetical protein
VAMIASCGGARQRRTIEHPSYYHG